MAVTHYFEERERCFEKKEKNLVTAVCPPGCRSERAAIGGLSTALNAVPVGVIYSPVSEWNSTCWANLVKYAKGLGTPIIIPSEGDMISLGGATSDGVAMSVEAGMVDAADIEYTGSRKSMKFYRLECESVIDMAEKNKVPLSSREDTIKKGFQPCGRYKP